jgi:hypothetical protein
MTWVQIIDLPFAKQRSTTLPPPTRQKAWILNYMFPKAGNWFFNNAMLVP